MSYLLILHVITLAAALFCLGALITLIARTLAFGKREYLSQPQGEAKAGVIYAFGKGMMPWEKESAALHLPTFIGGIVYHATIFIALIYLFWLVILPGVARPIPILRVILATGTAAGIGLFVKRAVKPHLRRLSCPDDFFANLFVDLFLGMALLHTFFPGLEPALLCAALLLFIYIPLGKIRHCFFFFYTRILFGIHYGRRGLFGGSSPKA